MAEGTKANAMSMRRLPAPLVRSLAGGACLLIASAGAGAVAAQRSEQESEHRPTVSVTGVGQVRAAPDVAEITVGVVSEAATAKQALADNNRAMEQLFDVLQQQGIAEKDRQTTSFNVSPQYRHDGDPRPRNDDPSRQPRIVGYQVSNLVHIKVRKVADLGVVLDAVVSAGSNQIHGIQFSIEQQDALMDDARRRAIRRARQTADLLAEAAGVKVGQVVKIEERNRSDPGPQPRMMMAEATRSVPIAAGEQTVEARVHVTYRLETGGNQ